MGPNEKEKRRVCLSQTGLSGCAGAVKEEFPEMRREVGMVLSAKEGNKCRARKAWVQVSTVHGEIGKDRLGRCCEIGKFG